MKRQYPHMCFLFSKVRGTAKSFCNAPEEFFTVSFRCLHCPNNVFSVLRWRWSEHFISCGKKHALVRRGALFQKVVFNLWNGYRTHSESILSYTLNKTTPVATATFRDSLLPRIGISAMQSHCLRIDSGSPRTSLPNINAIFFRRGIFL